MKVEKGLSLISSHNYDLYNNELLLLPVAETGGGGLGLELGLELG